MFAETRLLARSDKLDKRKQVFIVCTRMMQRCNIALMSIALMRWTS